MNTEELFFNGVNGTTGEYLQPPLTPAKIAQIAQGEKDSNHLEVLKQLNTQFSEGSFGTISEVDPDDLEQAGWGVIFPVDKNGNTLLIKQALKELLDHRKNQAGKYYKEYFDSDAYVSGYTAGQFLAYYGAEPSQPANPEKVPYYLLIVGDPEEIPFNFQYQLDVQYAVGRIYFDTLDDYAQYARSVVAVETGKVSLPPRKVKFFGVENEGDPATKMSANDLIKPLSEWTETKFKSKGWDLETILAKEATKSRLGTLLGGDETPAFLFTASHGLAFSDTRRETHTGALLCQDWYRSYRGGLPEDWYFSGDDISSDAKLLGLITFHFACFGAGTPKEDVFGFRDDKSSTNKNKVVNNWGEIAPKTFVARLPQKLLSHPNGGALAFIGHIDRAWNQSFSWNLADEKAGQQIETFRSTLFYLMSGKRLGFALEEMNKRYAALSTDLANLFERRTRLGGNLGTKEQELVYKWTANNDARGYAIIGDPAVRLCVGDADTERSVVKTITLPTAPITPPSITSDKETGLKQAQIKLIQSLEDFLEEVKKASKDEAAKLQAMTIVADSLLKVMKTQSLN